MDAGAIGAILRYGHVYKLLMSGDGAGRIGTPSGDGAWIAAWRIGIVIVVVVMYCSCNSSSSSSSSSQHPV